MKKHIQVIKGLTLVKNKFEVIKHILNISNKNVFYYKLKNGIILEVPNNKKNRTTILSINEIFGEEIYPINSDKNVIIVDLGAQAGLFSMYANLKNKNAKIYCFEPDKSNYDQVIRNIRINNFNNIHPYQKAIAGKKGSLKLFISDNSSRANSIFSEGSNFQNVSSITIKDMLKLLKVNHIDILKVDIEGAEYESFYKTDKDTLCKIGLIFMECHNFTSNNKNYSIKGMNDFLVKNGFSIINEKEDIIIAKNENFNYNSDL